VTVSVDERDATDQDWRPEGVSPGRYVVVSVVDGGGGIPAPIRERVFEPFFSTKDGANSGLGLSIVRQVAEQHGGGVGIHPVTVDGVTGTRMELWLPARSVPAHATASVDDVARRSVRILLVDDDDDVRRSTRHLLEGMGHDVVDVRGASGALATVEGGDTVDLVLCDVRMPGMGGAELVRRLRAARPGVPVLFVTGYADDLASAPDLRDVPVLVKPYGLEDLAGMIERHAGGER
jgi:CheY-like chemotaxis protein